jgi:hypothetical protein
VRLDDESGNAEDAQEKSVSTEMQGEYLHPTEERQEMDIKKTLVRGTIGVAIGVPLAVQLIIPAAASARPIGPMIITASPNSGPTSGGTTVTITGTGLEAIRELVFGNVPASYTIVSNTEIIATSPAESAGTVTVEGKDPTPTYGTAEFTYSS